MHLHGFYAEIEAIVEVGVTPVKAVRLANRSDAVRLGHAKRADLRHILLVAATHVDELVRLWEIAHG